VYSYKLDECLTDFQKCSCDEEELEGDSDEESNESEEKDPQFRRSGGGLVATSSRRQLAHASEPGHFVNPSLRETSPSDEYR